LAKLSKEELTALNHWLVDFGEEVLAAKKLADGRLLNLWAPSSAHAVSDAAGGLTQVRLGLSRRRQAG
jgi:hypothetical protein